MESGFLFKSHLDLLIQIKKNIDWDIYILI